MEKPAQAPSTALGPSPLPPLPTAPAIPKSALLAPNPRYKSCQGTPLQTDKAVPGAHQPPLEEIAMTVAGLSSDLQEVLGKLWGIILEAGQHSALYREYSQAEVRFRERLRACFYFELRDVPVKTLKSRLGSIRRWRQFAEEASFECWAPEPWQLKLYIFELVANGRTVPQSQLAALKWTQTKLQLKLCEDWTSKFRSICTFRRGTCSGHSHLAFYLGPSGNRNFGRGLL